jgi:hypothetical protein
LFQEGEEAKERDVEKGEGEDGGKFLVFFFIISL